MVCDRGDVFVSERVFRVRRTLRIAFSCKRFLVTNHLGLLFLLTEVDHETLSYLFESHGFLSLFGGFNFHVEVNDSFLLTLLNFGYFVFYSKLFHHFISEVLYG